MLSVVVPVYNVEKYLARCLDSLVNQTLKDIEIICVNDGSTDNSRNILETYAQKYPQIKVIDRENGGQSAARNTGIDAAKGDYIGFVDSDDWVDLGYYEKLYNAAKKYDADIAVSGIIRFHKFHKKFHLKIDNETVTSDINEKVKLCDVPDKSYVWNKIYRTSKIIKFEEGVVFEDVIFTPQILFNTDKLVTVPDIYYHYRRTGNSTVTQKSEKNNNDSVYAHKKALAFFKEHNINVSHASETKRYKVFGLTVFKVTTKNDKKEYRLFNIIKVRI